MSVKQPTTLQKFYADKTVFVTGGTGFIGKLLIEKLLRSCQEIDTIYMLARSKKGKDMHTRVDEMFDDMIFDRLRKEFPKFRNKVVGINGDCSLPNLGLNVDDIGTLTQRVNLVFHVAATVKFDEKLKTAYNTNVKATRDLLRIFKMAHNLKGFVFISTAYSNCIYTEIEERFYEEGLPNKTQLFQTLETLEEQPLEHLTPKLIKKWPNTYAFTKYLAEIVVKDEGFGLPITVFRPSIVVSTKEEPVGGWINNLYGPTGVQVGVGAGLIRTLNVRKNAIADIIPADLVINGIIAAAWDISTNKYSDIPIYNFVSSCQNPLTWSTYMQKNIHYGELTPTVRSIWCYDVKLITNKWLFQVCVLLLHFLPAILVDSVLTIMGKKPKLTQVYNKIYKFSKVIAYFATQEWKFHEDNVKELLRKVPEDDQRLFPFDIKKLNWDKYFETCVSGCRLYMFKDDPSTIPAAKARYAKFYYLDWAIKIVFVSVFAWLFIGAVIRVVF